MSMQDALFLASPFGDHMVLQSGRRNPLWGSDRPGQVVGVTIEGPGVRWSAEATTTDGGGFSIELPELPPGGPYRLSVKGSQECIIEDVLSGEVWLASGQSNMEWKVAQALNAEQEIRSVNFPSIRCLSVTPAAARAPALHVSASWSVMSPDTVGNVTAAGFFFARELVRRLNVPVGILEATWGGSRVEAWTSVQALAAVMNVERELAEFYVTDAEIARLRAEYAARVSEWGAHALPGDPGNRGVAQGWARPDYDDSRWESMPLPGAWQAHGLHFNGVVWFRRTIKVPSSWAGKDLVLSLGAIDDFDSTYFNGELAGSHPPGTPDAFRIPRSYTVPGRLVKAGTNLIAVRVFDHYGEGGFIGAPADLFVEPVRDGGERISVHGAWKYAVEHEIPLVPVDVFASFPPPPRPLTLEQAPGALYNGMLAPLIPYGIRGAIWYQGESNVDTWQSYRDRFGAFIADLHTRFLQGQFPFYCVQLANYVASDAWPRLREAQAETSLEPARGMAVAIDIGEAHDIHPPNKQEVARRLALLALAETYGLNVECRGPALKRAEISAGKCRVCFAHAAGLCTANGAVSITGFELAGADQRFFAAEARIDGEAVIVESAAVPLPCAIRYAFRDNPEVNLVNAAGLPAVPFRTDRW